MIPALANAELTELVPETELEIILAYNLYNQFISKSALLGFTVTSENFGTGITLTGSINTGCLPELEKMVQEIGNGRIGLTVRK
jgi:hypothetical protein